MRRKLANMHLRTDPLPPPSPPLLEAAERIKLELQLLALEMPRATPHERLREARRRCARAMTEACNQIAAQNALEALSGRGPIGKEAERR